MEAEIKLNNQQIWKPDKRTRCANLLAWISNSLVEFLGKWYPPLHQVTARLLVEREDGALNLTIFCLRLQASNTKNIGAQGRLSVK